MINKIRLFCIGLLLSAGLTGQEPAYSILEHPDWQLDYSNAQSIAAANEKPILIFFTGSDWCGPCKMLVADFFESPEFLDNVAVSFVLYEADFPRNRSLISKQQSKSNFKLQRRYGISSYPTIVVVNARGKKLGMMKGYNLLRDTKNHYSFLDAMLEKHKKSTK